MKTHDQLAFHNVAELIPAPGGGFQLARFPRDAWSPLDSPGADIVRRSDGCEIRFVTNSPRVRIFLRSLHGNADIVHLRGNQHVDSEGRIEAGKIHGIQIELPPLEANRADAVRDLGGFSQQVCRIYSCGAPLVYHGVDSMGGDLRPPNADELPKRRWLAYGSSITQGGGTFHNYINAAAQMLEAQVCNLGMAGSCFIEKQIADFIASREDWDFASFELGVNMVSPGSDNGRFAEKVNYQLDNVTARHPLKPAFLITIFDFGCFHEKECSDWQRDAHMKNSILSAAVARYPGHVHLIDGRSLVADFRGFKTDLLHPEPFASTRIGLSLAAAIAPVLDRNDQ